MKPSIMPKIVSFFAALSLATAAFAAAGSGPSTSGSSTRDFSREASGLLAKLHQDAAEVRDSADTLEEYNRDPFVLDWRADADTLDSMRDQVNNMDDILFRLQTIKNSLPPEQQAEINKATPPILELTDTAQAAITFMNKYENRLWAPAYTEYAHDMYREAGRIERSTVVAPGVNQPTENRTGS